MKAKLKKSVGFLFGLLLVALGARLGSPMPESRAVQSDPGFQIEAQVTDIRYGQQLSDSILTGTLRHPLGTDNVGAVEVQSDHSGQ